MKVSLITFSQLRRLLLDLHFDESRADSYWRFEHPPSETVFVVRPYTSSDNITMQDLASTRTHLDWRGLLSADAFDDLLMRRRRDEKGPIRSLDKLLMSSFPCSTVVAAQPQRTRTRPPPIRTGGSNP
jgi:hypothetical protein